MPVTLNASLLGSKAVPALSGFSGNPICDDRCDCSLGSASTGRVEESRNLPRGGEIPVDLFPGKLTD